MTAARDTPMMRQYRSIKSAHPDAILLYRMGDFYEMFFEDAERAAPLLDIALTSRDRGKPDPIPMCGIPVHSADPYIKRLAELGHRVAICEQVEDPKQTGGRRLVRRAVVEVVTPGLVGDPAGIEAALEVAIVAVALGDGVGALAALDASTGDFRAAAVSAGDSGDDLLPRLVEELERIAPREVLVSDDGASNGALAERLLQRLPEVALTRVPAQSFDPASAPVAPEGFDARAGDPETCAAAAVLAYLAANQPALLSHAPRLRKVALADAMVLDTSTRSHLELFENSEDRGRRGTLIECLDDTRTPLGARRLARWVRYPLLEPEAVRGRQDGVAWLAERDRARSRLRAALRPVRDLERLFARAARPGAVPRDLGALRDSLAALPDLRTALESEAGAGTSEEHLLGGARPEALRLPEPLPELVGLLAQGLIDDPPVVHKGSRGAGETGYIRPGFRPELDGLRESAAKGREWIAGLEAQERQRTGIASLKIRHHPVHGYSLEVSKSQQGKVPGDYERKQTLANVERFTTEALREVEGRVLGASDRAAALEREILESLRVQVVNAADAIRLAADATADLDASSSLAEVARQRGWVRPVVDEREAIEIRAGRHPVVEATLQRTGADDFVPNDCNLDPGDAQILLLTGPNMSGKSTYLRQVALIVLLAQMGSFVPAESARIGAVDRIFTRVGASDRLARGESTFMVEMRETAEILAQASRASLVILDEIGRGTSTFDGLSIAWAVAEYLHDTPGLGARTLFATHYHELTDLARTKARVRNAHFEAREWKEEVVFLRRLVAGGASRSYGIQVARLAGLPEPVIARARQILANLEGGELDAQGRPRLAEAGPTERDEGDEGDPGQLALFGANEARGTSPADRRARQALAELLALDPDRTTPIEALLALQRLHASLGQDGA